MQQRLKAAARAARARVVASELLDQVLVAVDNAEPSTNLRLGREAPVYQDEADAARRAGLDVSLVSFETLVEEGNAAGAVRRVAGSDYADTALYRGWMLSVEHYAALFEALEARGLRLVNTPEQYRHCHHLPASYEVIRQHTPRSVWLPMRGELDLDDIWPLLEPFGDRPLVLKDYVKSRKHEWQEACFIPSAADREAVERVVRRFLELQGQDLAEGLVFREFVDLAPIGKHSKSGMPLTEEYRLFFLDGHPLLSAEYWEEGKYGDASLLVDRFLDIATRVQSRFFTMGVARRRDGQRATIPTGLRLRC